MCRKSQFIPLFSNLYPPGDTELVNDFEAAIFPQFPAIGEIKNQLYASGAIYASLTGSGSAVYGIFEKGKLPGLIFPAGYRVFHLKSTIR